MSMPMPPAPLPPPAPQKKSNVLLIIVLVIVGVIGLGLIAAVAGGLFIAHKVHEAAQHPHQAGLAIAKLLTANDPNAEVVSTDDENGTITIRDKRTGKTFSANFDDIENGHIKFSRDGQDVGSMKFSGEGENGKLEMKSADGSHVEFGAGENHTPDWVPTYPGTPSKMLFSAQSSSGNKGGGMVTFELKDSPSTVADYYEEQLKKSGSDVKRTDAGMTSTVVGNDKTLHHKVVFTVTPSPKGSAVHVVYSNDSND